MKKKRVDFIITIPETKQQPTDLEIRDWIKFCLGATASLSVRNPLCEYEFDDVDGVIISDYDL